MTSPVVHVTDAARRAIEAAEAAAPTLRITISDAFTYDLRIDAPGDADVVTVSNGISIVLDQASAARADGLTLDFVEGAGEDGGFSVENPNVPAPIRQISVEDLKAMLDAGDPFELLDVRTPGERALAAIDGSRLLDQALHDELMTRDRTIPLVFQCHHGMRSQSAAEHFQRAGFRRLYNLQGGIDAWSQRVDPSVARY